LRVEIKKLSLRSLGLVALICLTVVPAVRGQQGITSILNLHYPSQAALENGVAVVPVTFEMYFNYYSNPQGYLVFGVYNAGTLNPVPGSAASSPNPCQSLAGTPYANDAVCAMIPAVGAGGSGTESASLNLTLNQPQAYSLSVVAFVWDSTDLQSGNLVSGSRSTSDFTITVTGQTTSTQASSTLSSMISSFSQQSAPQPVSFQAAWGSFGNGTGQFHIPTGVAIDSSGNVYVADTGNDRIEKFTSTGTFILQWGSSGTGPGQFNKPWGVAVDPSGNVYVTDTGNSRVETFTGSGSFISQWGTRGSGPGQFSFLSPVGIAVDSSGNAYVVDTFNARIEKFTSSGSYLMQFGSSGTGPGQLSGPNSVAVDSAGNVFVTDAGNFRVEEFSPSGTFSSTFGSNGTGPGQFTAAYGIATDSSGNVYVVDGQGARVEEFTSSGTFLFQWPCATGTCATGASSGQFNVPDGIAIAPSGLLYVTDTGNNQVNEFSLTPSSSVVTSSASSTTEIPPSTPSPGSSDIMSTLSQNTPLLTGAIIVLVVLLAGVMLRRRKPRGGPATGTRPKEGVAYCMECGAQNSATDRFCKKCGAKLES